MQTHPLASLLSHWCHTTHFALNKGQTTVVYIFISTRPEKTDVIQSRDEQMFPVPFLYYSVGLFCFVFHVSWIPVSLGKSLKLIPNWGMCSLIQVFSSFLHASPHAGPLTVMLYICALKKANFAAASFLQNEHARNFGQNSGEGKEMMLKAYIKIFHSTNTTLRMQIKNLL